MSGRLIQMALCAVMLLLSGACSDVSGGVELADVSPDVEEDDFNDHTRTLLETRDDYFVLAKDGASRRVVKFLIDDFYSNERTVHYADAEFYVFHDEWFWFRLLNGRAVKGSTTEPIMGESFASIADVYAWAREQEEDALPLDLRWVDGDERLYSPEFYTLALQNKPRTIGAGSLMQIDAIETPIVRPELWVFELEYSDKIEHEDLVLFFEALEATLPEAVASKLLWAVRSPWQEELAIEMETRKFLYHDRIIRYSELAVPGEVEVYSEGITAGRIFVAQEGGENGLEDSKDTSILMTDVVPDYLPLASGLITAVPQTPLAHINVLARNRGIPNVYVGGALDDPAIEQLAGIRAPAVLLAEFPKTFSLVAITNRQFDTWRGLRSKNSIALPPVKLARVPLTYVLSELDPNDVDTLRLHIGGKAAGFLGLMAPGTVTTPDAPLAITVKAYAEHLADIHGTLERLLDDSAFKSDARMRFMMLEGLDDYNKRYTSAGDKAYLERVLDWYPEGSEFGDILLAGGIKQVIRDKPIEPATLETITQTLRTQFGRYSADQGLRFRSSSSIEDIEGFNGAGLYDSNTGFIDPLSRPESKDQKKTFEWAIKKTWASYWGFEAFEERKLERIDHLSGHMAVLVHARFDDPLEISNGVFTLTLMPSGSGTQAIMELNVLPGDESVTNPEPGGEALPEVDLLVLHEGSTEPDIERVSVSNRAEDGKPVLSDKVLRSIFEQALSVAQTWLRRENQTLQRPQYSEILTLDFEFREMDRGWPKLASGKPFASRVVIKQARSLDPGLRQIDSAVRNLPFPRDLLRRTLRVERRLCNVDAVEMTIDEVFTDPLLAPDVGYSKVPFTAQVSVTFVEDVPELGVEQGFRVDVDHLALSAIEHPGMEQGSAWNLEATLKPSTLDTVQIDIESNGSYSVTVGNATTTGDALSCTIEVLHATPEDYLRSLLDLK